MRSRLPTSAMVFYAGLSVGVAFVATPAKFLAPHLSLPVALEVGHQTFRVFHLVEWGVLGALLLLGVLKRAGLTWWACFLAVAGIVGVEAFWLMPALDARVQVIIGGGTAPSSALHIIYIAGEGLKASLLLVGGLISFDQLDSLGQPQWRRAARGMRMGAR
jgi:hypothetical protein